MVSTPSMLVGAKGAGFLPALRAQLLRQLGADEVVVAQQAGDDDAVAVGQPGVPFRRQLLALHEGEQALRIDRHVQEAAQRAADQDGHGERHHRAARHCADEHVREVRLQSRPDCVVDLGQLPPRQWGAPRHARVQELLAVEVAIEQLQPQRMKRGRGPLVKGLQVAGGELGGSGEHRECRHHQVELAVDVVGEIACDLLDPAVELLGLRARLAYEQQAGRHQRRHHQACAEQQEQRRQPQPAGRSGGKGAGVGRRGGIGLSVGRCRRTRLPTARLDRPQTPHRKSP